MISYEAAGQTQLQLASPFVAAAVLKAGLNACRLLALKLVNLKFFLDIPSQKTKNDLPTYGPSSDEEWS